MYFMYILYILLYYMYYIYICIYTCGFHFLNNPTWVLEAYRFCIVYRGIVIDYWNSFFIFTLKISRVTESFIS